MNLIWYAKNEYEVHRNYMRRTNTKFTKVLDYKAGDLQAGVCSQASEGSLSANCKTKTSNH